jgi:hypothetical protein
VPVYVSVPVEEWWKKKGEREQDGKNRARRIISHASHLQLYSPLYVHMDVYGVYVGYVYVTSHRRLGGSTQQRI